MTAELHITEQDSHKDLLCVNNKAEQQRISRKHGQTPCSGRTVWQEAGTQDCHSVFTKVLSILHPQVQCGILLCPTYSIYETFFKKIFFLNCVCVCICVCLCLCVFVSAQARSIRSSGAGVTSSCELPNIDLTRAADALTHYALSPAFWSCILRLNRMLFVSQDNL